jgi:hypothetical protein
MCWTEGEPSEVAQAVQLADGPANRAGGANGHRRLNANVLLEFVELSTELRHFFCEFQGGRGQTLDEAPSTGSG